MRHIVRTGLPVLALSGLLVGAAWAQGAAQDSAMWGGTPSRNMVSDETGLVTEWDPESGQNIRWSVELGSQTYGGPVLIGDMVLVGTNNQSLRNPKHTGDRGVVMAFSAADGEFLWQASHTKLPAGRVNDWPQQGVCSTPFIEGDRLWYVSNQAHVVCADLNGFRDGENDGPITDEADTSDIDADYIWSTDMMGEFDAFPHNLAVCSPLVVGDLVFVVTGNGVDEGHLAIPSPFAPSFIALNKHTGELVWEDASPGMEIVHGQWSNPAYGVAGGTAQVIFPGGDGWVYSLAPETGELIWKFDCNPKDSVWELGGSGTRNNIVATPVIYEDVVYIAVGQDPEHGEGPGHMYAIDATQTGDVTDTAAIWHVGGEDFHRTMTTVAVKDDIVYTADLSGYVYALDRATGGQHWRYDTYAAIWGSAYVADGKVYIGDEDGDIAVLKQGKEEELLYEVNMGSAMYTTPVAKDGVMYLASRNRLYAVAAE